MPYVQTPEPVPRSFLKRILFPLSVVIVFGSIFASPWISHAFEYDTDEAIPFLMFSQLALPIGVILLTIWWLFFSGLSWAVRLGVFFVLLIAGAAGSFFSIRKTEMTSHAYGIMPRFHFVWEPEAEELHKKHLEQEVAKKADDLKPIDATVGKEDFANFRGPNFDGKINHLRLETDWTAHPPKVLWKQPCPGGYSGVAVAGNIAVTMQQRGEQEVVVCYDRETGRERWAHAYDAFHKDVMGHGPRTTPTIHDGHIYTLGARGHLHCLTVEGKPVWSINIIEDCRAKAPPEWGLSGSPLIVGDLVVVNAGTNSLDKADAAMVAYRQKDKKRMWSVGNRPAGYSSPQLASLGGMQQVLLFDGAALAGYDPKTGKEMWTVPWVTKMDMNMMQPIVLPENRIFISSELDNGCAMLKINPPAKKGDATWTVETLWKNKNLAARFANPVSDGKHIYGLQYLAGELRCLDVESGSLVWRGERQGPGQMLLVGDVLLVVNGNDGVVTLFATGTSEPKELTRHQVWEKNDKTWNTPAIAGDQLFIRNQKEIVCLKLPTK